MDWSGSVETRNYRIKRVTDSNNLTDLLRIILPAAILVGFLCLYSCMRSQLVDLGYEAQYLKATEETLLREQKNLILEEETLKNPERIDFIARNELGMSPLRPNQLIPPMGQDVVFGGAPDLAMARTPAPSAESRKLSANY